jgi:hypothetical protein
VALQEAAVDGVRQEVLAVRVLQEAQGAQLYQEHQEH